MWFVCAVKAVRLNSKLVAALQFNPAGGQQSVGAGVDGLLRVQFVGRVKVMRLNSRLVAALRCSRRLCWGGLFSGTRQRSDDVLA